MSEITVAVEGTPGEPVAEATVVVESEKTPASFKDLKTPVLHEVCDAFGIEHESLSKPRMLAELAAEGITWEHYQALLNAPKVEIETPDVTVVVEKPKAPLADSEEKLVKMERANVRFDILGYSFTKEHPFAVMSADEYQQIHDMEEGFRLATPREMEEFYN